MPEEIYRQFRSEISTGDFVYNLQPGLQADQPLGMVVRFGDLARVEDSLDPLILTVDRRLRTLPEILKEMHVDAVALAAPVERASLEAVCDVAANVIEGGDPGHPDDLVSFARVELAGNPRNPAGDYEVTELLRGIVSSQLQGEPMMLRMRCAAHNNPEICSICG